MITDNRNLCTVVQFIAVFSLIMMDFKYSEVIFDMTLLRVFESHHDKMQYYSDKVL